MPVRALLTLFALLPLPAVAHMPVERPSPRRTTVRDVSLHVTRTVLPNGMIVLLSPDAGSASVVVDVTFRAGALYEPPTHHGLAHLVEHMMMTGRTPETDYLTLLETRGGRELNANTSSDLMSFRTVTPPEELPLALWVAADRLGTLPRTFQEQDVERNRKVVGEERRLRLVDEAFGRAEIVRHRFVFPEPHPLSGTVIGTPDSLKAVTLADVRAFVDRCLVPANGIVTIVGNFDPDVAQRLLADSLGRLPGGVKPAVPTLPPVLAADGVVEVKEPFSRRPRVSMGWALPALTRAQANALDVGAMALRVYTDGAFGTDVDAHVDEFQGGALFSLDVTLPHDKSRRDARDDAESFLRFLTRAPVPFEVLDATMLALDRGVLATLDSPTGRATLITWLESRGDDPVHASHFNSAYWELSRDDVQYVAKQLLSGPKIVIQARPLRPLPLRSEHDD